MFFIATFRIRQRNGNVHLLQAILYPRRCEKDWRIPQYSATGARSLKQNLHDDLIPSMLEPEDLKANHTWARLIQKG
jgi:hypothetical protein